MHQKDDLEFKWSPEMEKMFARGTRFLIWAMIVGGIWLLIMFWGIYNLPVPSGV